MEVSRSEMKKKANPITHAFNRDGVAYDASGTELKLFGYIVENFKLTDDIILDKIKLFFSEDIGSKALLGMDILSLFDFQYLKERRQNYGTFWINNYDEALKDLQTRRLNKDIDYIELFPTRLHTGVQRKKVFPARFCYRNKMDKNGNKTAKWK